jgi:hypothetical protein
MAGRGIPYLDTGYGNLYGIRSRNIPGIVSLIRGKT